MTSLSSMVGQNSGLDILHAVKYLQTQAMNAFKAYVVDFISEAGLSTRVASDIALKLATGIFAPIAEQIDPMRLAEMQRANDICFAYGNRLNKRSNNLQPDVLPGLVLSYPSHSFVIDRKEAKSIFVNAFKPEGELAKLSSSLYTCISSVCNSPEPCVELISEWRGCDDLLKRLLAAIGDPGAGGLEVARGEGDDGKSTCAGTGAV